MEPKNLISICFLIALHSLCLKAKPLKPTENINNNNKNVLHHKYNVWLRNSATPNSSFQKRIRTREVNSDVFKNGDFNKDVFNNDDFNTNHFNNVLENANQDDDHKSVGKYNILVHQNNNKETKVGSSLQRIRKTKIGLNIIPSVKHQEEEEDFIQAESRHDNVLTSRRTTNHVHAFQSRLRIREANNNSNKIPDDEEEPYYDPEDFDPSSLVRLTDGEEVLGPSPVSGIGQVAHTLQEIPLGTNFGSDEEDEDDDDSGEAFHPRSGLPESASRSRKDCKKWKKEGKRWRCITVGLAQESR